MKYKNLNIKLAKLEQQQTTTPREKQSFYHIIISNINITFTNNEISLLEKGLKYNLHTKKINCLTNLALEAETAVTQLPNHDSEFYRRQIGECIQTLHHQITSYPKQNTQLETRTM